MLKKKIKKRLKILMLAVELAPFAKVGGLADVTGALSKTLSKKGVDIRICLPYYSFLKDKKFKPKKVADDVNVVIGKSFLKINIWKILLPQTNIPVYLIGHKYFSTKTVYHDKNQKLTNPERFSFFTRAALEAAKTINFRPNVVHAHDSHTGLCANFIRTLNKQDDFFINTKVLFTIHNLAYQEKSGPKIIEFSKIDPNSKIISNDAKDGDINYMVQGILSSDIVNTVSPRYAKEILHQKQGSGLDNILRKRKKDLYGILNGIDMDFFNPATDKFIKTRYSRKTINKKIENKVYLQEKLGLWKDENIALVGFVSRLAWQKGLELIDDNFANLNCQFVFLGTGEDKYEKQLRQLAKKHPHKISAQIEFSVEMAQQIYAASDIFLMPSRFEPCGLGQMIAMRYGAVPVVRETGGLANTVFDYRHGHGLLNKLLFKNKVKKANGFSFKKLSTKELYSTLERALDVYYNAPKKWKKLQINGMKTDFSWDRSALEYLELYNRLSLIEDRI